MTLDLRELHDLTDEELEQKARDNPAWFESVQTLFAQAAEDDIKRVQINYYAPANAMALPVHLSTKREVAVLGGNRSSKTTTALADLVICATGHLPHVLLDTYPLEKITGPIRGRIVCNSLTDTLEPVIFPKLRWDTWNGIGDAKDGRGHWGLIPQHCLVGGTWESAFISKTRTIRVAFCTLCTVLHHTGPLKTADLSCRGCIKGMVFNTVGDGHCWPPRWAGVSTIQCLSYDQDLTAFAGSSMHKIIHDELPPSDLYRENQLRTMDVRGQIITAFTPPDEAGTSRADVSWFFDHVYEPGLPGPHQHPDIETVVIHTEQNTMLRAEDVAAIAARLTEEQQEVRLKGRFIHLSGVIFNTFTKVPCLWCFRCSRRTLPIGGVCPKCDSDDLEEYCHVIDPFEIPGNWPVLQIGDPHPRKDDELGWFAISPADEVYQCGELNVGGTAQEVKRAIDDWETSRRFGAQIVKRLGDPNILTQSDDRSARGQTLRSLYDRAGLRYDLAIDDINTGIQNVNERLIPDRLTRRPRWFVFNTCPRAIQAATHWSWDEYVRTAERDPKERPRDKWKDPMDLWRYLANDQPSFHGYRMGNAFQHRRRHGR